MTVLVVGDANADISARLRSYPAEGDDSPVEALGWGSGGAAVNVAAGLALLGTSARLLARVGRDPAGQVALGVLRDSGVDLGGVQVDETLPTGLCYAAVSPGGERTFFSYRGANANLAPPREELPPGDMRWLHVCGHALLEGRQRETTLALVDWAIGRAMPVSLDLCLPLIHARRAEVLDLLPALDVLFVNEPELGALAAIPTAAQAERPETAVLEARRSLFAVDAQLRPETVVIKLGERGCLVSAAQGDERQPAFAVDAVDTTGCGDAFAAGFIHARLRGASPADCAVLANAIGALVATRAGAAEALPSRAELRAFLAAHARALRELV